PELRARQSQIKDTLKREEDSFNKTLDKGIALFEAEVARLLTENGERGLETRAPLSQSVSSDLVISGAFAFRLYDEQGFPIDLTELMARERGLMVDVVGFETLMDEQRDRARRDHAKKKSVIALAEQDGLQIEPTKFLGYDFLETEAVVEGVISGEKPDEINLIFDRTALYAEMGGQVGDHGFVHVPGPDRNEVGRLQILDTQKKSGVFLHRAVIIDGRSPEAGEAVRVVVDGSRRNAIQRHHTVTHLLHWALHEIASRDAVQKGSYVGPDKLTFDFSSAALSGQQVKDVEKLVNERIAENAPVTWTEVPFSEVRGRPDVMQFFGDKYGDLVRVVQIGGHAGAFDGYSMELCAGTHTRATGDIRYFKVVSESAIAAGIRRIEAVAGDEVLRWAENEAARQQEKFEMLSRKKAEIAALPDFAKAEDGAVAMQTIESRAAHLKQLETEVHDWEKQHAKAAEAELRSRAVAIASELAASHSDASACITEVPDADGALLQAIADILKTKITVPIVLAGTSNGRVDLIAVVPKNLTTAVRANEIIQQVAAIVDGKGGGRPDSARGSGKNPTKLSEALAHARAMIGALR
ncbi:MAG: alanine--tRNA ligase-related protein, partial [Verrucomicrobiota bacterium]|nr:alanine--tRNA ligase-related protein [Verrucomicrobiota bacterium]